MVGDYSTTGLTGVALVQHNLEQQLGSWANSGSNLYRNVLLQFLNW